MDSDVGLDVEILNLKIEVLEIKNRALEDIVDKKDHWIQILNEKIWELDQDQAAALPVQDDPVLVKEENFPHNDEVCKPLKAESDSSAVCLRCLDREEKTKEFKTCLRRTIEKYNNSEPKKRIKELVASVVTYIFNTESSLKHDLVMMERFLAKFDEKSGQ
jgi:hypothetical protein